MLAEDELQDLPAHFPERGRFGQDLHALLDDGAAGQRVAAHPVDLHHAQAAAAERREILVGTERGDVDVVQLGGPEHRHALRAGTSPVVDLEGDGAGISGAMSFGLTSTLPIR